MFLVFTLLSKHAIMQFNSSQERLNFDECYDGDELSIKHLLMLVLLLRNLLIRRRIIIIKRKNVIDQDVIKEIAHMSDVPRNDFKFNPRGVSQGNKT